MRSRLSLVVAIGIVCFLLDPVLAQVQTTTSITGVVRDSSGGVLPGVTITVENQETGFTRQVITDDTGHYTFPSLNPGVYTIQASLTGFRTAIVTDRELLVAIPAQVNFTLEVGEVSDQITVSAAGEELINTSTAELSTTINQDLVENLPVETRNYFDLLALAPNTSPQYLSTGNMSFGQHALRRVNAAGSMESSGVFAAGNRDSASNVSIDGANNQMALYNMTVNIQSASTIKELRLQTASANAEFGYGSNAVNVITKGGTNEFHGEAFWQHRNDNLDALGFFTNLAGRDLPEYKRNKFGASFGGPILRDKLLFFQNYEGSRLRQAVQANTRTPTAQERSGDLSDYHPLLPGGELGPTPTIYNPFDFDPNTGLRQPFPGNQIPENMLDPAMQALMTYTALPNTIIDGIPQYSGLTRSEIDENQTTTRIDWQKSETTTVYGRYSWAERDALQGGLLQPLSGENTPSSTHNSVIHWTQLFGPRMVNDLTVTYGRVKWGIGRPLDVPDVSREMGLVNTSSNTGSPNINGNFDFALGTSGAFVWDPTQNTYQIKDDISYTTGEHSLKFGIHVTERRLYRQIQSNDKGQLWFQPIFSAACPVGDLSCEAARDAAGLEQGGLGFADLLLGTTSQTALELRTVQWHGDQRYYGVYAQDTWQVHPRLTLNFGLRYEKWRPWLLPRNTTTQFDLSGEARVIYALANPLDVFDPATDYGRDAPLNPEIPREGYKTNSDGFAPRIGFAFQITPNTSLRAAGGIFYAGNINVNQLSSIQQGAAPFTTNTRREIAGTEQSPPYLAREQFPTGEILAIPQPGESPPATPRAIGQPVYPSPSVYQWSLSFQHRLSTNWSVHFDYLGSHTIHNSQFVDLNAGALPTGELSEVPLQERRRFTQWGQMGSYVPWGWGKYNSGTIGLRNREWNGLSFMANFQWAKNLTSSRSLIGSDQGNVHWQYFDIWNGRSNFVPTARFVSGWSYKLPFGQGRQYFLSGVADAILGGWIVSGITEFSTGGPITVTTFDNSGTGVGNQLPDRVPGCEFDNAARDRFEWFNTGCFAEPEFATWGDAQQGLINDPGINNWNVTLAKTFQIQESQSLEFRMESFNIFNHTQWGRANTNMTSSGFGRINDTRPARQIQFALFYNF